MPSTPAPPTSPPGRRARRLALLAAALTTTLALGAGPAAATPPTGYTQADLERDLDAIHDAEATSAVALVVGEDGHELAAATGVADLDTGKPAPVDGHFRIGSVTKTFTATVVLQLAGEGRLSLEDTIADHLPGVVAGNGNDGSTITIRHLLQHTSGLYDATGDLAAPMLTEEGFQDHRFDSIPPERVVAAAVEHRPAFEPGTKWAYNNTGYLLVGMLVERVTGNPWGQEVRQRIVEPLGLHHTGDPGTDPTLPEPHAEAYMQFTEDGELIEVTEQNASWAGAAGGLVSTTVDLNRFFRALLAGELLEPAQQAELTDTIRVGPDTQDGYGLGLGTTPLSCGITGWNHSGAMPGYSTLAVTTQDGRRSAVVSIPTTTGLADPEAAMAQGTAAIRLVDNALCDR